MMAVRRYFNPARENNFNTMSYEYTTEAEKPHPPREVGTRMQHVRTVLGLRQKQVADALSVSFSHYSKVEVGINKPSNSMIQRFCDVFDVDLTWLTEGVGIPFHDVREPVAAYGNNLLASPAPRFSRRPSEKNLERIAEVAASVLSSLSMERIEASAKELNIPVERLLRSIILERLNEEFKDGR